MPKSKKCGILGCGSDEVKDTDLKFLKVPLCGSRRYKLWWNTLFHSAYLFGGGAKHDNYICSKHFLEDDVDYLHPILHLNNNPCPKVEQEVDIHLERRRLIILLNNALLEWARRFESYAPSAIPKMKFITMGLKIQKMLGLSITLDDFWWKNFRITHLFSVNRCYSHKTTDLKEILMELDPNVRIYSEDDESALNASPIDISQKVLRRSTRRIGRKSRTKNITDKEGGSGESIDRYTYSLRLDDNNLKSIDNIWLKPKEELQTFPLNEMDPLQPSAAELNLSTSEVSDELKIDNNDLFIKEYTRSKRVLDTNGEGICSSKKSKEIDPHKSTWRGKFKNCHTLSPNEIKSAESIQNILICGTMLMTSGTNNQSKHNDPPKNLMPNRRLSKTTNLRTYSNTRKKKLSTNCENPAVNQIPSGSKNASYSSTSKLRNDCSMNSENVLRDIKKEPCEELQINYDFLSNRSHIKTEKENINQLDRSIEKTERDSNGFENPNSMSVYQNLFNAEPIPMLETKSEHYEHQNTNDNADSPADIPTVPQCPSEDAATSQEFEMQMKSYSEVQENTVSPSQNNRLIRTYSNARKKQLNTNCENPEVSEKPNGSKNLLEPSTSKSRIDSSMNFENVILNIKKEPCEAMQIYDDFSSICTQLKTEEGTSNINKLDTSMEDFYNTDPLKMTDSNFYKALKSISDIKLLNEEAIPKLEIKSNHFKHHNTNDNVDDAPANQGSATQIKSYSEALEHIKPLENYFLCTQNYKLIDLVLCLEKHLKCVAQSE